VNKVWKYRIPGVLPSFSLDIPKGAAYLCTREQDNRGHMWWAVDPSEPVETHHFLTAATGEDLPPHDDKVKKVRTFYRGSFMMDKGAHVFHVFEKIAYK
jgi:hypothetical protein